MNKQRDDRLAEIEKQFTDQSLPFTIKKIPEEQLAEPWFTPLIPLIENRLRVGNPEVSPLLQVLFRLDHTKWEPVKGLLNWARLHVGAWESALGISKRIRSSPNPDIAIEAAFSELRCSKYLSLRGFENINFQKRALDLQAEFEGALWEVEVTNISGDDFKTQESIKLCSDGSPVYRLDSKKLINRLKSKYDEEEQQIQRQQSLGKRYLIVIVTSLLETYNPWLDRNGGHHPIEQFVDSCSIPTVVIGGGTIYEPEVEFVCGPFPIDQF